MSYKMLVLYRTSLRLTEKAFSISTQSSAGSLALTADPLVLMLIILFRKCRPLPGTPSVSKTLPRFVA